VAAAERGFTRRAPLGAAAALEARWRPRALPYRRQRLLVFLFLFFFYYLFFLFVVVIVVNKTG
jgi:hypothetical protein